MKKKEKSTDFVFKSNYLDVFGSNMHYIDEGEGDPIIFLHGNPTSSYLWRNIIPYLTPHTRCIAPDLIGMGKSDKPDIGYRFFDHSKYLEEFINKLALKNVTIVVHDWGSALGFHYAMRHEGNIKGIAFMESMVRTKKWEEFAPEFRMGFKMFRTPIVGWLMISVANMFIKQILPKAVVRELSVEEKAHYANPYQSIKSRKPIRVWPQEIPIEGEPQDVYDVVSTYNQKLQESNVPKILFYAEPGGLIDADTVKWCRDNLKNLETVDIGDGLHFLQEDNPHLIGEMLAKWYTKIN